MEKPEPTSMLVYELEELLPYLREQAGKDWRGQAPGYDKPMTFEDWLYEELEGPANGTLDAISPEIMADNVGVEWPRPVLEIIKKEFPVAQMNIRIWW